MLMSYTKTLTGAASGTSATPQNQPIPGREDEMAQNNAGGFTFTLSPWDQLDRFLILGTESGTYYTSEQKLTRENAQNVLRLIAKDGIRVVNRVVEISDAGRAPKNDPALFVLALASAADSEATRKAALAALPKVARIGTHLFHFAAFVDGVRGWGRALKRAVADWYLEMPVDRLASQVIKYQQRDGWSHRDMLRLAHPQTDADDRDSIFRWVVGGMDRVGTKAEELHPQILAFEAAKRATSANDIIKLIQDHNLPREAIPTQFLTDAKVWEALLTNMPLTAMVRNLATMTRVGLLTPMSQAEKLVKAKLSDTDVIQRSRLHPVAILAAFLTYSAGKGVKGSNTWTPVRGVVDALDQAFYGSFKNVTPTGKNTLLALDVSASMTWENCAGVPGLTPRVGSAAMALVTANVESSYEFMAFTSGNGGISQLKVSPRQRLDDVVKTINSMSMGGTDCALPMVHALNAKLPIESFAVYTDNETWAGRIQPSEALKKFRNSMGIPAKLAVVGMTSTGFSIADPKDAGMMDFVGFDASAPAIMSDFFSK
jgi:60 kDa SS-A/Ro ribonucleoprotein